MAAEALDRMLVRRWVTFAMTLRCDHCGIAMFEDEAPARKAAESLIRDGQTDPLIMREYHMLCVECEDDEAIV